MAGPRVQFEGVKVRWGAWVAGWLAGRLLVVLARLARTPLVWLMLGVGLLIWQLYAVGRSWAMPGVLGLLVLAVLIAWRLAHPRSFRPVVSWRWRAWRRKTFVYRRQWVATLQNLSLTKKHTGADEDLPGLVSVRSTGAVDTLRVRLLPGQVLADYGKNADRFAAAFDATGCRVRSVPAVDWLRPIARWLTAWHTTPRWLYRWAVDRASAPARVRRHLVELWLLINDPLTEPVPAFDVPETPDLDSLPVALREDGLTWRLRLLATHLLIVGATGAGKGSVLWSIIRSLAAAVSERLVELWVIDPKGGMELAAGLPLYARFCYGQPDPTHTDTDNGGGGNGGGDSSKNGRAGKRGKDGNGDSDEHGQARAYELAFARFLEDAVTVMQQRQAVLRGRARTHTPTPGDPLIVLVIDEIASLTAYVTDREAKKRISSALALLLSQGRAVGVVVIAAGQDARKEVLPDRGLFPARIAMRLSEPDDVDMVLGNGQRDKGARCDEIPLDQPGTAYVVVDELPEPVRVRFGHVTDAEIDTTAKLYALGDYRRVPDRLRLIQPDTEPGNDDEREAA